jgi:hypothetical protein
MNCFESREPQAGFTSSLPVHVPHSSRHVPLPWRSQIVLDEAALARELLAMTDHHADELSALLQERLTPARQFVSQS